MPSSQSLNSPKRGRLSEILASGWLIWLVRIATGALFAFSGFVKAVDPWGSIIKIGEYFDAWSITVPDTLIVCAGFILGAYEFVWGGLLLTGCYRKGSVLFLLLQMAVMLPLTAYIMIFNPVDDCGCFGDAIVISNTATFIKNIIITLLLVYLLMYNARVPGLFITYVQWIVGGMLTFYILGVELYGYNIQPVQDYRRFPAGTVLVPAEVETEEDDEDGGVEMEFVYEKDGHQEVFGMDNLPDSTWMFVERRIVSGETDGSDGFTIIEDGEDVAPELIDNDVRMLVVTIPDVRSVDLSATYVLNELNDFITSQGGGMIALVGSDEDDIDWWRDISMATYPIVRTEPKQLKELARGNAALVYLDHGTVVWKRTVSSITGTVVRETPPDRLLTVLDPDAGFLLRWWSICFGGALALLFILDRSGKLIKWHMQRRKVHTGA